MDSQHSDDCIYVLLAEANINCVSTKWLLVIGNNQQENCYISSTRV